MGDACARELQVMRRCRLLADICSYCFSRNASVSGARKRVARCLSRSDHHFFLFKSLKFLRSSDTKRFKYRNACLLH